MRPACALALFLAAAACRKTEQPIEPPAPAVAAQEPAAPEPAPAPAPITAAAPAVPSPAAASAALADAATPAPASRGASAAAAREPPAQEADDATVYRWEDAQGVVHFGRADDVPPGRRASAKAVETGISLITSEPLSARPAGSLPPATSAADEGPAAEARSAPGDEPELDQDGLPIPGTMKETAHTRAVKAATGGAQLDPASVERQREEDNRRMKCRVVDGVTICG